MDFFADNLGWFLLGAIVLIFAGLLYFAEGCSKEREALIKQCRADGRENYECEAMFDSHCKSAQPIFIPMGH